MNDEIKVDLYEKKIRKRLLASMREMSSPSRRITNSDRLKLGDFYQKYQRIYLECFKEVLLEYIKEESDIEHLGWILISKIEETINKCSNDNNWKTRIKRKLNRW
jgi:hypothetical protein